LSNASTDPTSRAGLVSDLWDGAGTRACYGGGWLEPRTVRHDPPILGRPCSLGSRRCFGNGWAFNGTEPLPEPTNLQLDAVYSSNAGCALGWMAVLRPRLEFAGHPQSEYVYADCDGDRRGLGLQRRCRAGTESVPRDIPHRG